MKTQLPKMEDVIAKARQEHELNPEIAMNVNIYIKYAVAAWVWEVVREHNPEMDADVLMMLKQIVD